MHAEHVERQRAVAGKRAETHHGRRHRDAGLLGELAQLVARVRADDAAAGVNDRALGELDRRRDLANLLGLRLRFLHLETGQIRLDIVVGHGLVHLHILRHIDQHRALAAGGGDDERFLHDAGHVVHIGHKIMMLRDAAADFHDRRFLERVGADDPGGHLAGDRDQRDAVELGIGDGRDEIRGTGAARGHAHAHLARAAGHALRGKRTALLMAGQNRAKLVGKFLIGA